jgi:hypothetical protein
MHKHDWPMRLNAHAKSGRTIAAFCAARGLSRSRFFAERAKLCTSQDWVPIVVEASELQITLSSDQRRAAGPLDLTTLATLAVIGVTSFVAGEWALAGSPAGAFFLLPYPAWELVVGALLALRETGIRTPPVGSAYARWRAEAASALGLAMITVAVLWVDKNTPWPGRYALLPTLGTALLI